MESRTIVLSYAILFTSGSLGFAQPQDFRPSAKDPKDQRQMSPVTTDECQRAKQALNVAASRSPSRAIGGYSLKDIAGLDCSHAIILADLYTDFKTDYELWHEAFDRQQKQQQAHDDAQQAARNEARKKQNQVLLDSFHRQQEQAIKAMQPKQQPSLSPPRVSPPPATVPSLDDPITDEQSTGWLQDAMDEARAQYGGNGDQNEQPGISGVNGTGRSNQAPSSIGESDGSGIGVGPGSGIYAPHLPAQAGESADDTKARRDREVERRKAEFARKQEEEAKAKQATDEKQAIQNGNKMQELLGGKRDSSTSTIQDLLTDSGERSAGSLDDLLSVTPKSRPDSSPTSPRTQAEKNADAMRDLLGSDGKDTKTANALPSSETVGQGLRDMLDFDPDDTPSIPSIVGEKVAAGAANTISSTAAEAEKAATPKYGNKQTQDLADAAVDAKHHAHEGQDVVDRVKNLNVMATKAQVLINWIWTEFDRMIWGGTSTSTQKKQSEPVQSPKPQR